MAGTQGKNLEVRTKSEAIQEQWLANYSLPSLLSYVIQNYLANGGTTHHDLAPSTSVINQEHVL